jgi:hypothetical protein
MDCPICLSTIRNNCGIITNCCNTKFHKKCLNLWYKNCNNIKICPHCRSVDFESEIKNIESYNKINIRSKQNKNTIRVHKNIKYLLNKMNDFRYKKELKIINAIQIFEIIKRYPYILINNKNFFKVYKCKVNELLNNYYLNTYNFDLINSQVNEKFHQILLESKKMIKNL